MPSDFRWMSMGGMLIDATGDIASTDPTTLESIQDMVRTRLKAALDGWQLYRIGADLENQLGNTLSQELEISIRQQVSRSLSKQLLPKGSFQVQSYVNGQSITVLVYLNQSVLATATVSTATNKVTVQ